ncbi:HAMP domain-containing sensor histidine kinase [Singulisphaera acidiphila]|uniref:histidine kinase n=1 Tax=Singulisphaera acidiphila (strain ATCC BAA-1392 / DSM 18658 / VKM B-2454 / MOB10) TaxID=886293 RepID=L0DLH4_SINAD|nr:ATP-binding protein [Singulisphaera acidiphila]AGA29680.1 PAS domain S-box [Singulisphaera acidiphila DSM 18658]
MFRTLRTKLLVGLTPLVAIMIGLGLWAIVMLDHLGGRIDVILRENYDSVLAAEGMKEALERMDSATLFALSGRDQRAQSQFREYQSMLQKNLEKERSNVTLKGEQELADRLAALYETYLKQSETFYALPMEPPERRSEFYFAELFRTFTAIKNVADQVLEINQSSMLRESVKAREAAARSKQVMIAALLGSAAIAALIALQLSRSILEPIRAVTIGARGLARGNLDQVVPATTRDELGELAQAFNTMARTIREFRQAGTARLLRAQKTAQATIDSFPDPVVVVDTDGVVERANPAARRLLGVIPSEPESSIPWTPPSQLKAALAEVLDGRNGDVSSGLEHAVIFRDDGHERYYLPRVLPIRGDQDESLGAALVLSDVTKFRLVDQLKSDMVSTVSHELKTPLTSVQMAIHLLLEEVVGPLTSKQVELLVAARQDSDRLLAMVDDLLDLTRIEQGRLKLNLSPVKADELVAEAAERSSSKLRDAGIVLEIDGDSDLPLVLADRERMEHVFDNLIDNALQYTDRGGRIRLTARTGEDMVHFTVEDTGEGIAPEQLSRIFEKFYRVPGTRHREGTGLGLSIVQEIIVAHGGQITASSRPGLGTTFTFTLPADPRKFGLSDHSKAVS